MGLDPGCRFLGLRCFAGFRPGKPRKPSLGSKQALADARAEAARIVADAKAEIQAELDVELKKADAQIAAKTAESEKAIAEIRAGAVKSVTEVAKATAKEIVSALGGSADAKTITAAVTARMKG